MVTRTNLASIMVKVSNTFTQLNVYVDTFIHLLFLQVGMKVTKKIGSLWTELASGIMKLVTTKVSMTAMMKIASLLSSPMNITTKLGNFR